MPAIEWVTENEEGEEVTYSIPAVECPCSTCGGKGRHSLRFGAITQEDRERDWDPESWSDYMRGAYDAPCDECDGTGTVLVVDERPEVATPILARYLEHLQDEADYRWLCEAERRFGC